MSQSKKHSHYEMITNSVLGIIIGWSIVFWIFPYMGVETTVNQASLSSVMFFIASYARAYIIRRIFNKVSSTVTHQDKHSNIK